MNTNNTQQALHVVVCMEETILRNSSGQVLYRESRVVGVLQVMPEIKPEPEPQRPSWVNLSIPYWLEAAAGLLQAWLLG